MQDYCEIVNRAEIVQQKLLYLKKHSKDNFMEIIRLENELGFLIDTIHDLSLYHDIESPE